MFPDDYGYDLGTIPGSIMTGASSPELDSDYYSSAIGTPEGNPGDVTLVRYVKWNVPTADAAAGRDGPIPVRKAVPLEIPPDKETLRVQKQLSGRRRRSSGKYSFEIGSAVDYSAMPTSDSELDEKSKWQALSRCSPFSATSDQPDFEGIQALSELYNQSYPFSDDSPRYPKERLSFGQSMRETASGTGRDFRKDGQRISGIAEAAQKSSARSSSDITALKILGSRGLSSRNDNHVDIKGADGQRRIIISPLPTARQLLAAKAAHSHDTDSESADSSILDSGYSDMIGGYSNVTSDLWSREAAENPRSSCDHLEPPKNTWLKRSVAPFTVVAGAILVTYRVLKSTQRQN